MAILEKYEHTWKKFYEILASNKTDTSRVHIRCCMPVSIFQIIKYKCYRRNSDGGWGALWKSVESLCGGNQTVYIVGDV